MWGRIGVRREKGIAMLQGVPSDRAIRERRPLLQRTQLIERINEGRIVVLHAPMGYGKSTLLHHWCATIPSGVRLVWNDSATPHAAERFWCRILEQLERIMAGEALDGEARRISTADLAGRAGEDASYAAVRDALSALPEQPLVFVLDAFYYGDTEQTRDRLAVLQAEHPGLRVVAASRLRLGLAGLAGANVLTREDLSFDSHDTMELASLHRITLDEARADAILDALGDWPALVDLAIRTLAAQPDPIPSVDRALCAISQEWDELLACPAPEQAETNDAYRTAPARIESGLPSVEPQGRPSGLGDDDWEAFEGALASAVEEEEWNAVADLLEKNLPALIDADANLILTALRRLPPRAVRKRPRTRAVRRVMLEAFASAGTVAQGASAPLLDLANVAGSKGLIESIEASLVGAILLRRAGYFRDAAQVARVARLSVDAYEQVLPGQLTPLAPAARAQLTLTFVLAGYPADATEQLTLALRAVEGKQHSNPNEVNRITGLCAARAALVGDLDEATAWADRVQPAGDEPCSWLMPSLPVSRATTRAIVAIDRLDQTEANRQLTLARREESEDELWPLAIWVQANLGFVWGDHAAAFHALEVAGLRHREWANSRGPGMTYLVTATANLYMATGEGSRANALLSKCGIDHPAVRLASARLDYLSGTDAHVLTVTREVCRIPGLTDRCRLDALLLHACAVSRSRGIDESETLWREACNLAEHMGGPLLPFAMVDSAVSRAAARRVGPLARTLDLCRERGVIGLFPERLHVLKLTNRETDVLQKLADGASVASIAKGHFVAPSTIKSQLRTLYGKLGVHSRAEAVRVARESGLL